MHWCRMSALFEPPSGQYLREDSIRGGMDLLFFANTRHLKRADEKLASFGLGRAHHRVLYFVARRPDISVGELLTILDVTKQSFGRVATNLIESGFVEHRVGERDRRQRLLRLSVKGHELERDIFDDLHANVAQAYSASGGEAVAGFWIVMQHLMGAEARIQFQAVQTADSTIKPL